MSEVAEFTIIVNGTTRTLAPQPGESLLTALRDRLGITGPKFGCGEGACGACTVLLGRRAVTACTTPAAEAAGQRVTTVEGLAEDGTFHPVQQAWLETGALQCGFCTPGWLTATAALLAEVPDPGDERIKAALAGHVCRCCTYPRILRAVRRAAELLAQPGQLAQVPPDPPEAALPGAAGAGGPPWDQLPAGERPFFEVLPDGLVAVAADGDLPATGWATSTDAWLHVGADGAVTAFTGKIEEGQGTRTALALAVAEELAVPAGSVQVVMGDTGFSPFDMGTFGSRSMPDAAPRLRRAAAAARRVLLARAGQRFGLPAGQLHTAAGAVTGPDGAPRASYGELLTGVRQVALARADEELSDATQWRAAGHPVRAVGAEAAVTGRKRFPSDLRLPGMLHGCVLRPPGYGGQLVHLDVTAAAAEPGVQVVQEDGFTAVVADSPRAARQALARIRAEWAQPAQPAAADLPGYLRSHPAEAHGRDSAFRHEEGDVDAALAGAPTRLAATYSAAYIAHVPLEPRSALASWDAGRLTVWAGTSTPFRARSELAGLLRLPESRIRVIAVDFGGGFGGKHGASVAVEAARLSRAAGRPVKVQWSREEEFRWGYLRPAALIDVESGTAADGQLTGWSFTNINSGQAGIGCPYRIAHQRIVFQPARSPLPQGSYRALAATANHFARESHLDEVAHRLGADPLELRLRHLDDDRLAEVLQAAAGRAGWGRPQPEPGRGRGIACGIEKGGRVATSAEVSVAADGTLRVLRLVTAFDCGTVINPDGLANQIEGAAMMALGGALFEQIDFADGRILNASLAGYRVPRLPDLPEVAAVLLDRPGEPPAGGGETPLVAVAPAIANAIFDAAGVRLRSMPLAPDGTIRGRG